MSETRVIDAAKAKVTDKPAEAQDNNKSTPPFEASDIWKQMAVAPKHEHEVNKHIKSLPDLDLHSSLDPDGKKSVAEDLIDDLNTLLQKDGKINVYDQQAAKLLTGSSNPNLPIIECDGLEAGKIGIIMSKHKDGHTYYAPFISAGRDPSAAADKVPVRINEAAAKELKIEDDLKKGITPKLDVFAFDISDDNSQIILPRTTEDLHSAVLDRLKEMAEDIREKDAILRAQEEAAFPDAPKPDPEFGYRRTERTPDELRKISADLGAKAREYIQAAEPAGIQDRMKAFGAQAQKDITFWENEVKKNKIDEDRSLREEKRLSERLRQQVNPQSAVAQKLDERIKAATEKTETAATKKQLAEYNLSYAQWELKISKDQPKFTRHMQAMSSAAAIMALNPDMDGSLSGHRFVLNAGHYPEDPKFAGFEYDGTAEWKLNLESQDVGAAMIRMAGGAVKLVNQSDLADKSMTGLANAIKAAKPEVAVGIHHDDAENRNSDAMKGTLTLECSKSTGAWSLDFARASHFAKVNYGGVPDKFNKNGVSVGIREQCGRGVQGRNVDAPFILDEQFSTHKDMWPMARDPKVNAQIQFARVVAMYEYVNKLPRYKATPDTAKAYNDQIWSKKDYDDVFAKRPKVGAW